MSEEDDKKYYGQTEGISARISWNDPISDPIADIRAMAEHVASQTGYEPTTWVMNSAQKESYDRFIIWFEETKKRLDLLPRRRYFARRLLECQMYGYPTSTSVRSWFWGCVMKVRVLRNLRYKIQDWRAEKEYENDKDDR